MVSATPVSLPLLLPPPPPPPPPPRIDTHSSGAGGVGAPTPPNARPRDPRKAKVNSGNDGPGGEAPLEAAGGGASATINNGEGFGAGGGLFAGGGGHSGTGQQVEGSWSPENRGTKRPREDSQAAGESQGNGASGVAGAPSSGSVGVWGGVVGASGASGGPVPWGWNANGVQGGDGIGVVNTAFVGSGPGAAQQQVSTLLGYTPQHQQSIPAYAGSNSSSSGGGGGVVGGSDVMAVGGMDAGGAHHQQWGVAPWQAVQQAGSGGEDAGRVSEGDDSVGGREMEDYGEDDSEDQDQEEEEEKDEDEEEEVEEGEIVL